MDCSPRSSLPLGCWMTSIMEHNLASPPRRGGVKKNPAMKRVINFNAGPAAIPLEVLQAA